MEMKYTIYKNGEVYDEGETFADDVVEALYDLLWSLPLNIEEIHIDSDASTGGFAPYCSDGSSWGPWDSWIEIDGKTVDIIAKGCNYCGEVSFEDLDGDEWTVEVVVRE